MADQQGMAAPRRSHPRKRILRTSWAVGVAGSLYLMPAFMQAGRPPVGLSASRGRCLGRGGRPSATAVAASAEGQACASALEVIAEEWHDEAMRCWGNGDDGLPVGLLADMTTPGREYSPLVRTYTDASVKPKPMNQRPWQRTSEGQGAQGVVEGDKREEDYEAAVSFMAQDGALSGGVALDVGCGDGYMARRFLEGGNFERVFAFDVDWRPLEFARAAAERSGGAAPEDGLYLLRADAQDLPFREESVSFAWWGMGMHKVQDAAVALKSLHAVLQPGGRLIATTMVHLEKVIEEQALSAGFSKVQVEKPRTTELVIFAIK